MFNRFYLCFITHWRINNFQILSNIDNSIFERIQDFIYFLPQIIYTIFSQCRNFNKFSILRHGPGNFYYISRSVVKLR